MTERPKVNLRVDTAVLDAYATEIEDKYGKTRPYAGTELERELRAFLDGSRLASIRATVVEIEQRLGVNQSKKEIRSMPQSGETRPVQYRVAEDVRANLIELADESDEQSAGDLVGRVMWRYVCFGGVSGQISRKLDTIHDHVDDDRDNYLSPVERRMKTIAEELQGGPFTIDDFDDAVKHARGIDPGQHATKTYLPKVLDELNYTWHPKNPELFVESSTDWIPDQRDPRNKPYELMDEEDKKTVIKITAYEKAKSGTLDGYGLTINEAVDALKGRPRKNTVRAYMKEIDDNDNDSGFWFDYDRKILKVKTKHADDSYEVYL